MLNHHDSSVIREIAGGVAVKCSSVKPEPQRYDGETRGHLKERWQDGDKKDFTVLQ